MKVKQGSFATQSNFIGKKIIAVIDATFAVTKKKPKKNIPACTGFEPLTSAIPGAALYQMS